MVEKNYEQQVQFSQEDLVLSFQIARGSIFAHALFVQGLSLKYGISFTEACEELNNSYFRLHTQQRRSVAKEMALAHRHNDLAKEVIGELARQKNFTIDSAFYQQIPTQQDLPLLQDSLAKNQAVNVKQIYLTLSKLFKEPQDQNFTEKMTNFCAFLGFYEGLDWWKSAEQSKKENMIEEGKKLYDQNLPV
jgi:hypothetical protein